MFKTGIFRDTRAGALGGHTDIANFRSQFEVSPVIDDLDMDDYNRGRLMNYFPDPVTMEQDQPRLNNFSKERLNLRHYGAFDPTMPWRGDDGYDTQFHDKDPRGTLEEIPWRKFHESDKARAKLRIYHSDADPSIPGDGIAPVDMVSRISNVRRALKGYMPWFSESIGSIAAGKTGLNYNTPHNMDMVTAEKDPYAFNVVDNQNVNRYNTGNLGGKYFIDRTTTDHVIPNVSYNFLFQTYRPETPADLVNMVSGDQKLSKLNESATRNIMNNLFVDNADKSEATQRQLNSKIAKNRHFLQLLMNNQVQGVGETSKFTKQLFIQNNPKKRIQMDVLSLLGITQQEIKWMESQKNVNKQAYEQCVANVIDMLVAMDGVPITQLSELRNKIMQARAPEFIGGCAKNTTDNKIKAILESRTPAGPGTNIGSITGVGDQRSKTQRTTRTRDAPKSTGKRAPTTNEPIDTYNRIFTNKRILNEVSNELRGVPDLVVGDSVSIAPQNRIVNYERSDLPLSDTDMGEERFFNYGLNSWNDSHLIPRQFKR